MQAHSKFTSRSFVKLIIVFLAEPVNQQDTSLVMLVFSSSYVLPFLSHNYCEGYLFIYVTHISTTYSKTLHMVMAL